MEVRRSLAPGTPHPHRRRRRHARIPLTAIQVQLSEQETETYVLGDDQLTHVTAMTLNSTLRQIGKQGASVCATCGLPALHAEVAVCVQAT